MIGKFSRTTLTPDLRAAGFSDDVNFDVTIGREYRIYAVATWINSDYYCVISDFDQPSWIPACLFDLLASDIPRDWVTTRFDGDLSAISGPYFIAKDEQSYTALVELEPESVAQFWKYVDK